MDQRVVISQGVEHKAHVEKISRFRRPSALL